MTHKHYIFNVIDGMPRDKQPNNLALYLKAVMMYFIANNKKQSDIEGDEMEYIKMLMEEYYYKKG